MDNDKAFRPRKVVPGNNQEAQPEAPQVNMEQVHAMQKAAGIDIPTIEGEMAVQGHVPPEFRQYMSQGEQKQRGPMARPQNKPYLPTQNMTEAVKELIAGCKMFTENYDELTLPSMGKFYDGKNGPEDGIIHLRPMTGNEEKILATPRFVKKGQAVNMIFKNCLEEKFDPEQLLTVDRTYLLIFLRGISYTPEYDVEMKCQQCDNQFQTTINLDTLYVDYCPEDFSDSSLVDVFPATNFKFKYRLSTGSDETAIQEHRDRRVKQFGDNAHDDTLLYRASLLIEWIETPSGQQVLGQNAIQAILEQLPIKDVAHIRNLLTDPPFGVDTKIAMVCPICNNDFSADLPLEANFFFPRTRSKKETPV